MNGWCVVPQELPPTLPVTNTLPERIARLRSDGALTDSDEILGLYLYRESSTATRDLFDRLVTIRRQPTRLRPRRGSFARRRRFTANHHGYLGS